MSISRKSVIGGAVGVIVAIGLIVAGAYAFGGLGIHSTNPIKSITTEQGISTTTGVGSSGGSSSTSVSSTTNGGGGSSGSSGILQISMIDPPHVPANVVDVYVNITSIEVHIANAGNQSGWYNVTEKEVLNLTGIISNSKLLGSATLPSGTYNIVRFNVTSALVTVNDSGTLSNYTANVPSGMVQSTITGGVNVQASATSVLLVDISPTITASNGSYTLIPSATAYPTTPVSSSATATTSVTQSVRSTTVSTPSHTTTS